MTAVAADRLVRHARAAPSSSYGWAAISACQMPGRGWLTAGHSSASMTWRRRKARRRDPVPSHQQPDRNWGRSQRLSHEYPKRRKGNFSSPTVAASKGVEVNRLNPFTPGHPPKRRAARTTTTHQQHHTLTGVLPHPVRRQRPAVERPGGRTPAERGRRRREPCSQVVGATAGSCLHRVQSDLPESFAGEPRHP